MDIENYTYIRSIFKKNGEKLKFKMGQSISDDKYLSGSVYIEMVFQWPGVGRMLVDAILKRDILLVQGGVLFVAICYVFFNIIVDILQRYLDPRITK